MPCSNPLQYQLLNEDLLCNRFSQNSNMKIGDNPVNLYFYKKYVIRKATATPKAQLQLPIGLHTEAFARYFWSTANCDSIAKFCSHTPQSNLNSIVNMSGGQSGLYTCLQLTSPWWQREILIQGRLDKHHAWVWNTFAPPELITWQNFNMTQTVS